MGRTIPPRKKVEGIWSVGIDMSKNETGISVFSPKKDKSYQTVIDRKTVVADDHTASMGHVFYSQTATNLIIAFIKQHIPDFKNCNIVLEDYAYGAKGRTFEIAEMCGLLKWKLFYLCYLPPERLWLCSIQHMKMFAGGGGNCAKEVILKKVWQQWAFDTDNNNIADAYVLSRICECISLKGVVKKTKLTKKRLKVLKKVEKYNGRSMNLKVDI